MVKVTIDFDYEETYIMDKLMKRFGFNRKRVVLYFALKMLNDIVDSVDDGKRTIIKSGKHVPSSGITKTFTFN